MMKLHIIGNSTLKVRKGGIQHQQPQYKAKSIYVGEGKFLSVNELHYQKTKIQGTLLNAMVVL